MRWPEGKEVDQGRKVIDVIANASLSGRAGAEAVAAPVVGDDLEGAGKQGHHAVPDPAVHPRSVDENERLAGAAPLVAKLNSVNFGYWHVPDCLDRANG